MQVKAQLANPTTLVRLMPLKLTVMSAHFIPH